MANLADTLVFGDLTVMRDHVVKGTLTVNGSLVFNGVLGGNGSSLTGLNASNLSSGTVPTARLPAAALVDTKYAAGSGLSLSGTTFSVSSPFNASGTYGSLRAQATTKADVGLSNVPNVDTTNASNLSSGTIPTARLPAAALVDNNTTYTAGSGLTLTGTSFSVTSPFNAGGNYASLRARGTTKADVGLGNVDNIASAQASTPSTLVQRDGSGDVRARLFRSEFTTSNSNIGFIMTQVDTGSNNFLRPSTPAQVKAALNIAAGDVSGLSDSATTTVASIRAGVTKANVGLASVLNVASYSKTESDAAYAPKTHTHTAGQVSGLSDAATTTVAAIRSGTTKANVGLGSVRNVASYSQAESDNRYLRKNVSDTLTGDLTVTGEVFATDVTITSDLRVKFDLQEVSGALAKVCSLTGYTYQMKGLPKGERRLGLVAQDVLKVFPETVHGSEETQYSLAYGNLVAALVQAIKEQQTTIESLEARLGRLEHQVNS